MGGTCFRRSTGASPLRGCARIPAVEVLRQVWMQQFYMSEDHVHWRADDNIPPASILVSSPYDPEAHLSIKRSTVWTGDIRACDRNL